MDLSDTSKQIWPPVNVDAEDEAFWDDKDLIDEYNRIESVVKDKLTLEIDKKKKSKSTGVNNKFDGNLIKDSFSACNDFKEKNADVVDCQSFDDNDNPVCNLQWIPPCTNPPAQLFSRLASSSSDVVFLIIFSQIFHLKQYLKSIVKVFQTLKPYYTSGMKLVINWVVHMLKS
ncbi:hypothetical protein EWB00_006681 [Schistosoma japonicum]|uniref:Uncharacterized protein n=1 Tax=Schistosoma japonicum TaxID=6182 RepID=A0A4Z2CXM2_SCHJA|nr:hypothetical protein EWB00_006681 [Schistosoma japonicum]